MMHAIKYYSKSRLCNCRNLSPMGEYTMYPSNNWSPGTER